MNWKAELSPELLKQVDKFADIPALAKGYAELQAKIGTMMGRPTSEDALADILKDFLPEEYELNFSEDIKSVAKDEVLTDEFKAHLKGLNLTQKQAQGMLDKFQEIIKSKESAINEQGEVSKAQRDEAFKREYPDESIRNTKIESVKKYFKDRYGEEFGEQLFEAAHENPDYFKKVEGVASRLSDDTGINDKNSKASGTQSTIDDLRAEQDSLFNKTHSRFGDALMNRHSPSHEDAAKRNKEIIDQIASLE